MGRRFAFVGPNASHGACHKLKAQVEKELPRYFAGRAKKRRVSPKDAVFLDDAIGKYEVARFVWEQKRTKNVAASMDTGNDIDDMEMSDVSSLDSFSETGAPSQDYGEVSPAKRLHGPSTKRARTNCDETLDSAESQDCFSSASADHGVDEARPRAIAKKQKRRDFWNPYGIHCRNGLVLWDSEEGQELSAIREHTPS